MLETAILVVGLFFLPAMEATGCGCVDKWLFCPTYLLGQELITKLERLSIQEQLISPLSLYIELMWIVEGIGIGNKGLKDQFETTLQIESREHCTAYENIRDSLLKFKNRLEPDVFRIYTQLFYTKKRFVKFSFSSTVRHFYNSSTLLVDYNEPDEARNTINRFLGTATNNLIGDIVKPGDIRQDSEFVLLNTIYFNGEWQVPFSEKENGDGKRFTFKRDGMFVVKGKFDYKKFGDVEILALHLKTHGSKMVFIIPSRLNPKPVNLKGLLREGKLNSSEVEITLPKFKLVVSHKDLTGVLRKIGVTMKRNVYLSKMADHGSINIRSIKQRSYIQVDEVGVQAGTVTAISDFEEVPEREIRYGQDPRYARHHFRFYLMSYDTIVFQGSLQTQQF